MPTRDQVCAWLALGLFVAVPAHAQVRTEQEIVELIVADGPRARAIRAEAAVTPREQRARTVLPNPTVTYTREGAGFTDFLQLEQPLPLFGARAALARAGVAASAAAEAERDARLWELRSNASSLVARLLAEQERLDVGKSVVREVERLIKLLEAREREGEGSRFDRLRAEQELADLRRAVVNATVAVGDARAGLAALLPEGTAMGAVRGELYQERVVPPIETLMTRATEARAELRALRLTSERFDSEATAARRARLPNPTLVGGVKRADTEAGRDRGGVFAISIPVPLFDRGGRDVERWQAEQTRVEAERASQVQDIRAEVSRAAEALRLRQRALLDGQSRPQPGDSGQPAAELTRIAEVAYREGEVGILELLDAQRTASRARFRAVDMRLDARRAQVALERAIGEALWP
jgi:cobalt-zinc-cadmium efflux system outer membrane protein